MNTERHVVAKEFAGKEIYLSDNGAWVQDADKARTFICPRDAGYSASFHKDAIVLKYERKQ